MRLFSRLTFLAAAALGALGSLGGCNSVQNGADYATPEAGFTALVGALSPYNPGKLKEVLGPSGVDTLDSGDSVADQQLFEQFVTAYNEKHEIITVDDDTCGVEVGPDNWPMPIPMVKDSRGWHFDTAAGKDEILQRRIGRNELDAIRTLQAIADAQNEYAAAGYGGAPGVYAEKVISSPLRKDGLAWRTAPNEPPSPMGELIAEARAEGYKFGAGRWAPYHGYQFRILKGQGPNAAGGAMNYEKDGKMTRGYAVVAWPAEYGRSGIMTFCMNQQGVIFQRDLGNDTDSKAPNIKLFDPDAEWTITALDQE